MNLNFKQRNPGLSSRSRAAQQFRLASFIDAVQGKHVYGEVDFYGDNGHDISLFQVS